MPGIGTGFDEAIKRKLFAFMRACYKGLCDQVAKGLDPKVGIQREFTEIQQYLSITQQKGTLHAQAGSHLLYYLKACYEGIYAQLQNGEDLQQAIEAELTALESYIDAIEEHQKNTYGSIWDQPAQDISD